MKGKTMTQDQKTKVYVEATEVLELFGSTTAFVVVDQTGAHISMPMRTRSAAKGIADELAEEYSGIEIGKGKRPTELTGVAQ